MSDASTVTLPVDMVAHPIEVGSRVAFGGASRNCTVLGMVTRIEPSQWLHGGVWKLYITTINGRHTSRYDQEVVVYGT